MIIRIAPSSDEPAYCFDIWINQEEGEDITDVDPDDGGICTSEDITDALDMAYETARTLIERKCPGCKGKLYTETEYNALSRYKHGRICSKCATKEALQGDFISKI